MSLPGLPAHRLLFISLLYCVFTEQCNARTDEDAASCMLLVLWSGVSRPGILKNAMQR